MDNRKALIEAAKLLKEHCRQHCCDDGCLFAHRSDENKTIYCCLSNDEDPCAWSIPKPRRWTDKDVALARALKAFGVYAVKRVSNGGIRAYTAISTGGCGVPKGAFNNLEKGEQVNLNDIIAEEEC